MPRARKKTVERKTARRPLDFRDFLAAHPLRFVIAWRHSVPVGTPGFHGHDAFEIVGHVGGAGTLMTMGGDRLAFDRPSIMLLPPKLKHVQSQTRAGDDICILFRTAARPPARLFAPLYLELNRPPRLLEEMDEIVRMAASRDPLARLSLDYQVTALLLKIWMAQSSSQSVPGNAARQHAARAHGFIQENAHRLGQARDAARELGLSYDYLRHVFKRFYQMGPSRWLMINRVEYAKNLVVRSKLPLKAVAIACGFTNEQHFCRKFREIVGQPPGAFRLNASKGDLH